MTNDNLVNVREKENIDLMWSGVYNILQGKEFLYKEMKTMIILYAANVAAWNEKWKHNSSYR